MAKRLLENTESHVGQNLHAGGISMNALGKLSNVGKKSLERENKAIFQTMQRTIEMPCGPGTSVPWTFAQPALLVQEMVSRSPALQEAFLSALASSPSSPSQMWRTIVAYDETAPGNNRQAHNPRKNMVLSFTWLELGADMITAELAWFTPCVLRSSLIGQIDGHWPHCLKVMLHQMFKGDLSFCAAGVPLELCGQHVTIYSRLHGLLSDNDGLRMGLDLKGPSGHRPCLECFNVWSKGFPVGPNSVDITCSNEGARPALHSDTLEQFMRELADNCKKKEDGALTKKAWDELQRGLGINWNPSGLLADWTFCRQANLLQCIRKDYMHGVLHHGSLEIEMKLFMQACFDKLGFRIGDWRSVFEAGWRLPASAGSRVAGLAKLFHANVKDWNLHAPAKDMLTMAIILRHFVEKTMLTHEGIAPEAQCFVLLCEIVCWAHRVKKSPGDPAVRAGLRQGIQDHFARHKDVYGTGSVVPKFHYNMHLAQQIEQDSCLIDMFVIERHHTVVKRLANHVRKTTTYESSVLSSLVTWQAHALADAALSFKPVLASSVKAEEAGALSARRIDGVGRSVSAGDMVRHGDSAGEVMACIQKDGIFSSRCKYSGLWNAARTRDGTAALPM
eukprot:TRINITY_DN9335_c0_g1_i4.p1 TRINITY_DN9335_c0_g1~~TRINITY_DN9335_c0_g1_i4.p1  ORF type:complete len:618 (+),score=102.22 TRINITY_DN9335_c0_g1_i4:74-1927(+)